MFAVDEMARDEAPPAPAHPGAPRVAREDPGAYDPGVAGGGRAGAGGGAQASGGGGAGVGDARRAGEARARLGRVTTTPGSPLGAAVGALAAALDALAGADPADEHVEVVGDALVALDHLRTRLQARELALLASFDTRGGYRVDGSATAAAWLRARTNTDYAPATIAAWGARRLGDLPRLAAHLNAGDITLAHYLAVAKAATASRLRAVADAQDILADLALTNPPRDVRAALRRLADTVDPDGTDTTDDDEEPRSDPLRDLCLRTGYGGRGELLATLDPLTREALSVLLDAFDTPDPPDTPPQRRRHHGQRRHDAFSALLHTLLAQPGLPTVQGARPTILITIDLAALLGLPPDHPLADLTLTDIAHHLGIDPATLTPKDHDDTDDPDDPGHDDTDTGDTGDTDTDTDADHAGDTDAGGPDPDPDAGDTDPDAGDTDAGDADASDAGASDTGASDTGGPAEPDTPQASAGGPARPPPARPPRFGSGVPTTPAVVRGLAPAATIMAVLTLGPWRAVNVGAKHRTLPAWLRVVLTAMHQHCRGPDCDHPASWTQAHHILAWALGHTTDLNDTLPLCPAHHKLIDDGWTATLDLTTGEVTWTSPTGHTIIVPPPT